MSYILFFVVVLVGLLNSFIDSKILLIFDEDDDYGWSRLKREISLAILSAEEFLIIGVCKSLDYSVLMIVCYSIVLWVSSFLFAYFLYKSE